MKTTENKIRVTACRKSHFNAAHRLHNSGWGTAKNKEIFGVCNNDNFHGHNYDLIVSVSGEIDPGSGYVMDMKILQDLVDAYIISRFDHKNLNLDVEDFRDLNPTAENIAVVIWNILRDVIPEDLELAITLYETERNFVEYSGPNT
ncbi:MAG: 6-carboxytetrahydropterin synthase [Bacteroidales bacterium]